LGEDICGFPYAFPAEHAFGLVLVQHLALLGRHGCLEMVQGAAGGRYGERGEGNLTGNLSSHPLFLNFFVNFISNLFLLVKKPFKMKKME